MCLAPTNHRAAAARAEVQVPGGKAREWEHRGGSGGERAQYSSAGADLL